MIHCPETLAQKQDMHNSESLNTPLKSTSKSWHGKRYRLSMETLTVMNSRTGNLEILDVKEYEQLDWGVSLRFERELDVYKAAYEYRHHKYGFRVEFARDAKLWNLTVFNESGFQMFETVIEEPEETEAPKVTGETKPVFEVLMTESEGVWYQVPADSIEEAETLVEDQDGSRVEIERFSVLTEVVQSRVAESKDQTSQGNK